MSSFEFDRVRSSSIEFDRVRSSSIKFTFLFFVFSNFRVFVIGFHLQFAKSDITKRITKTRKNKHEKTQPVVRAAAGPGQTRPHPQCKQRAAADRRLKTKTAPSVTNKIIFRIVKDQLSSSDSSVKKSRRAEDANPRILGFFIRNLRNQKQSHQRAGRCDSPDSFAIDSPSS